MSDQQDRITELLRSAHFDGYVEISAEEAEPTLRAAPIRLNMRPATQYWLGDPDPQILHDGIWKSLCRTDLTDNVATGWCMVKTEEEWREYYLRKLEHAYGVRYSEHIFAVIDSFSDG